MIGMVLADHVLLYVSLRVSEGSGYRSIDIEFVIDTGFIGHLTLPPAAVQALGLPFVRNTTAHLADGSSIEVNVYEAEIFWQGSFRHADVFAMGEVPLLGTLLLDGCEVNIRFADHEVVAINPL